MPIHWKQIIACLMGLAGSMCQLQSQPQVSCEKTYQYYGVREGLSQAQVFYGFEDSYGYLWFATYHGVSRFDGKEFKNYLSGKELDVSGRARVIGQYRDAIYLVYFDAILWIYPDGRIEKQAYPDTWTVDIGHDSAVLNDTLYLMNCRKYGQPDRSAGNHYLYYSFAHRTFGISQDTLRYVDAMLPADNGVWLFEQSGHARLVRGNRTLRKEERYPENKYFYRKAVHPDAVYRFVDDGRVTGMMYRVLPTGNRITEIPVCDSAPVHHVKGITPLNEHTTLLSMVWQRPVIQLEDCRQSPIHIQALLINNFLQDSHGNTWFYGEDGIYNCHRFLFDSYTFGMGKNDYIWTVLEDDEGNKWFGSYGNGLLKMDRQQRLTLYTTFEGETILNFYMGACKGKNGTLFFPYSGGVIVYDGNRFRRIRCGTSLIVYPDEDTGYTYSGGWNKKGSTLIVIRPDLSCEEFQFSRGNITAICKDSHGRIRIGTPNELASYIPGKGIVLDTITRPYRSTISMTIDSMGSLWKAAKEGVFVEYKDGRERQISDGATNFVFNYQNRYMLLGLPQGILGILPLHEFYTQGEANVRTFTRHQGFDAIECGQNGICADSQGYVWVIGGDKVIRFHPDSIMAVPASPVRLPAISTIYRSDRESDWMLVDKTRPVSSDYEHNSLRFELLQASIQYPDELTFRYRLTGYSEKWSAPQKERTILFNNLPPGHYCLEVQSSENGKDWSPTVRTLPIIIDKPFWLTNGFLLLVFVAVSGLVILIVALVRHRWRKKREEEQRLNQLRLRSIRSKYIPHFTGNVLSAINYLVLTEQEQVNEYISEFSDFSQQTLIHAEKPARKLSEEIAYTALYLKLEKLRFGNKLEYSISVDEQVNTDMPVPTMAMQTFCENAMKHGLRHKNGTGTIRVRIYTQELITVLSVEDNGIGRQKALEMKTEGSREGLNILTQQLEVYNRRNKQKAFLKLTDLYGDAGNATGTRAELFIPQHYRFL